MDDWVVYTQIEIYWWIVWRITYVIMDSVLFCFKNLVEFSKEKDIQLLTHADPKGTNLAMVYTTVPENWSIKEGEWAPWPLPLVYPYIRMTFVTIFIEVGPLKLKVLSRIWSFGRRQLKSWQRVHWNKCSSLPHTFSAFLIDVHQTASS